MAHGGRQFLGNTQLEPDSFTGRCSLNTLKVGESVNQRKPPATLILLARFALARNQGAVLVFDGHMQSTRGTIDSKDRITRAVDDRIGNQFADEKRGVIDQLG
ncbi:hypothetical protein FDG2_4137 [Candidatus Protofrankia californiensis]|uniref:Uncharacterized protein n=1 Tax=Candidatus Protofrankia californiensis TaxID=1839754 RepID=A0A1C3P3X4_9ACTN|nr:hypothetical protein FDG2_4137 [Candidatus Protofrankia californiensis]